jgi:hypothetical protein
MVYPSKTNAFDPRLYDYKDIFLKVCPQYEKDTACILNLIYVLIGLCIHENECVFSFFFLELIMAKAEKLKASQKLKHFPFF